MKTKWMAMMLVAGGALMAQPRVAVGVQFGAPGYYGPAPVAGPPVAMAYRPPCPGPGYIWIDGYYDGYGNWTAGYWGLPPYTGAYWVAPRFVGGHFDSGYWGGARYAAPGFGGPRGVEGFRGGGYARGYERGVDRGHGGGFDRGHGYRR